MKQKQRLDIVEYTGLICKYRVGRELTHDERAYQLHQKRRLNVEPHYQLSVIKMNSTYLESVDKWFGWKGLLTGVMLAIISIFVAAYTTFLYIAATRSNNFPRGGDDVFVLVGTAILIAPLVALASWLLKNESFSYTHFPIRFNRKSRMVYVFRKDGSVLSAPWDEIFFTLGHMPGWNDWEVRGHILEPDKATVRDTFALSYVGSLSGTDLLPGVTEFSPQDFVRAHWEFIRRYMEEGPEAISNQVQFCMPIDKRRESFRVGMDRVFANIAGASFLLYWIMFPFCLIASIFRVFAIRTSKVPQWPADIEAISQIELNDPYAIAGAPNGDRVPVFPEAVTPAVGLGHPTQKSANRSHDIGNARGPVPLSKNGKRRRGAW